MNRLIALDFDLLNYQASRLDQIAEGIGEAASAARSMDVGDGAFGVACNFLVPAARIATVAAARMIHECDQLVQRAGAELRKVASDAEEREWEFSQAFRALAGEIG